MSERGRQDRLQVSSTPRVPTGCEGLYWHIAVVPRLPDCVKEGILCGANLEKKEEHSAQELDYAIYCRSSARSDDEAKSLLAEWFADNGVPSITAVYRADAGRLVPTRDERKVARGLQHGDVLIKTTYVAFRKNDPDARDAGFALIREVFMKRK